jgi:hypothetical protein
MLEPLRQDFKKLKDFLDRQTGAQQGSTDGPLPQARQVHREPATPQTQMDLFG